jgi:hypothetical protein
MCNDRRRENLRMVELLRAWVPICHNCATRAMKLSPMPQSVDEIRRLHRERRSADRRTGRADNRVFPRNRRGLERRSVGHARGEDLMLLDEEDIIVIESDDPEAPAAADQTRIFTPPDK